MKAPAMARSSDDSTPVARLNRRRLRDAGVVAIGLAGAPGCGKTLLIASTIQHLMPALRAGVIACDLDPRRDAQRLCAVTEQVVQVNTGGAGYIDAAHIADALRWLDLSSLDVLFIESVAGGPGDTPPDLGQDALAAVFSVAGGDDRADSHAALVTNAQLVVLNKTDLLACVPFDLASFREDVRRLNPRARVIQTSALDGQGLNPWVEWLRSRAVRAGGRAAQPLG